MAAATIDDLHLEEPSSVRDRRSLDKWYNILIVIYDTPHTSSQDQLLQVCVIYGISISVHTVSIASLKLCLKQNHMTLEANTILHLTT